MRFTPAEAADLLNQFELTSGELDALADRTEGWAAGLQLVALSMQGRADRDTFIQNFTGSERCIVDYLVEEVLDRQPAELRSFLLQTAVLDRLSGALCDAVTARSDSQATLEHLERANMFLIPLDGDRQWYRYHHLFADMLRHRLQREQPGMAPKLHGRAGAWLEQANEPEAAMEHYLAAGDFDHAARLVGPIAWRTLHSGQSVTLQRWMRALPEAELYRRPDLCVAYAWSLLFAGQFDEFLALVDAAERALGSVENPAALIQLLLLQANWARARGDSDSTISLGRRALALSGQQDEWRAPALMSLGDGHLLKGELLDAEHLLTQSADLSRSSGSPIAGIVAMSLLADVRAHQGRLHDAAALCREAIAISEENPKTHGLCLQLGALCIEQHDLKQAEQLIRPALEAAERFGHQAYLAGSYQTLAWLQQAHGETAAAERSLQTAQSVAERIGHGPQVMAVGAQKARLHMSSGDTGAVAAWLHGFEPPALAFGTAEPLLTRARALILLGEPEAAATLAREVHRVAIASGWVAIALQACLVQALAHDSLHQPDAARAALTEALALGQPGGYVQHFVDAGPQIARLLGALVGGVSPEYLATLRSACGAPPQPAAAKPAATGLAEPLSDRELEVLGLVAEGLSNPEIGARLFISPGTVEVHLKNIFGKLGATNRVNAIELGRRYHLI